MAEYYVSDLISAVVTSGHDLTKMKMYVLEHGEQHKELTGGRIILNGGSFIFVPDEISEHHDRARLGNYSDEVHERRAAVK